MPGRACTLTRVAKQHAQYLDGGNQARPGWRRPSPPALIPNRKGIAEILLAEAERGCLVSIGGQFGPSRFQPLDRLLMAVNGGVDQIVELFELGEHIRRVGTGMKGERANVGKALRAVPETSTLLLPRPWQIAGGHACPRMARAERRERRKRKWMKAEG